jgi:DNA repair protein SbcD/Mre11
MVGLSQLPEKLYRRLLNSTFTALKRLIDTAIEMQVDFLIIAGDVYDGEDRSIRAQVRFRQEMERLSEHGIPVYLIHGNHDHLSGTWTHIPLPENVHVFGEKVEHKIFSKENVIVHLYGFSYPKRQVLERRIEEFQKKSGSDFHIGILHGNEGGNSSHGNYAPFSIKDLIDKQFDYWALGHIHKSKILCETPPIIYPGNIQGRHHKEQGSKGCYLVTLTDFNFQHEWIDTADVEWDSLEVDASNCTSFQEIYHQCTETMNKIRSEHRKGKVVKIVVINLGQVEGSVSLVNGELLEILQENESEEENFIWVSDIHITEDSIYDKEQLKDKDGFIRELLNTSEHNQQITEALQPLFLHHEARKHLASPNNEEQKNMLLEAERILLQLLLAKS